MEDFGQGRMKVLILSEHGYHESIIGLSLSKNAAFERAEKVAQLLKNKDHGHNKFLESMYVWLDVTAPRFWWQEADTYRLSTKQSASTMHTFNKRPCIQEDFCYDVPDYYLQELNCGIEDYNSGRLDIAPMKAMITENFLQRRIWVVNYQVLRNILLVRTNHRLPQWKYFCQYIRENIYYPELLPAKGEVDVHAILREFRERWEDCVEAAKPQRDCEAWTLIKNLVEDLP